MKVLSPESGEYFEVMGSHHHRLLFLLSELDIISHPSCQQEYFYNLLRGIRHYCLKLSDSTFMPFVLSWVPWFPWHHSSLHPKNDYISLTASFSFVKITSASLCSKHPKINFLIEVVILSSLVLFSYWVHQDFITSVFLSHRDIHTLLLPFMYLKLLDFLH